MTRSTTARRSRRFGQLLDHDLLDRERLRLFEGAFVLKEVVRLEQVCFLLSDFDS